MAFYPVGSDSASLFITANRSWMIRQHNYLRRLNISNADERPAVGRSAHFYRRAYRVCTCKSMLRHNLGRIMDNRHRAGFARIEVRVHDNVGASRLGTVGIQSTQQLLIVQDSRPGNYFSRPVEIEWLIEKGYTAEILPAAA